MAAQGLKNDDLFKALRAILDVVSTIAVIAMSGVVLFEVTRSGRNSSLATTPDTVRRRPIVVPSEPIDVSHLNIEGEHQAPFAILEYSDFQCRDCSVFAKDTLPQIRNRYIRRGEVFLVFRHLPLSIHPFAKAAAVAAECAGRQGAFWRTHDALFAQETRFSQSTFHALAVRIGVDSVAFEQCVAADTTDHISDDALSAAALGIAATPTFLLGATQRDGRVRFSRVLSGAQSFDQFERVLLSLGGKKRPAS